MKINKLVNPIVLLTLLTTPSLLLAKEVPIGTIEVSGALDISYSDMTRSADNREDAQTSSQNVLGSIVYYIIPNVGVGLDWQHQSDETVIDRAKTEASYNVIGPKITYNLSFTDKLSLKTSGALSSVSSEYSSTNKPTVRVDGISSSFSIGFGYFVNNNVSLNAFLSYIKVSLEEDLRNTKSDTSYFGSNLGLSVYFD